MNAPTQAVAVRENTSPSMQFRDQLSKMDHELSTALPPHMPVERFMRVVLTAVNGNPDLLKADRRTLFESAMKAAQDGLLPDGRDGAFVTFSGKVQWMPMVGGILKKVRNSGDLLTIAAHVAYEKDTFKYSLGDDEKIEHVPSLLDDRGKPAIVYAVAKTKDGGIYREVMSIREVEKVRNVSRAKNNGPWVQWWDEMAKKTVIRRLAKRLPMSSDLDDLIRRDDELYDFSGKRAESADQHGRVFDVVKNPLSDDVTEDPAPNLNSSQPTASSDGAETDKPASDLTSAPDVGTSAISSEGSPAAVDGVQADADDKPGVGLPVGWQATYAEAMARVTDKPKTIAARRTEALKIIGGTPSDGDRAEMAAIEDLVKRRIAGDLTLDEFKAQLREIMPAGVTI